MITRIYWLCCIVLGNGLRIFFAINLRIPTAEKVEVCTFGGVLHYFMPNFAFADYAFNISSHVSLVKPASQRIVHVTLAEASRNWCMMS